MDEFEIKATGHPTEADRIWTRAALGVSVAIADKAVHWHGYKKAVVVNTFGGIRSDELYVVEKPQSHSNA